MDLLKTLQFEHSVSVKGTNWDFVGKNSAPSWQNRETGHQIIIDATDDEKYVLRLNHFTQSNPWWTITGVDFPAELIPVVEWFISIPDYQLFNREAVSNSLFPFWQEESETNSQRTQTE